MRPVSEAPQTAKERELHAAFDRLLATFHTLPRYERNPSTSQESGKDSRRLILPDGTHIYMVHTKGNPDKHPVEEERIFANVTYYGIGETRLTQPKIITFLLSPSGLDDLFIDPVSVGVEIAGTTIVLPSMPIRVRRDSVRFSDLTKESLRDAAPTMVDWAIQVATDRQYSDPPYRLTVQ